MKTKGKNPIEYHEVGHAFIAYKTGKAKTIQIIFDGATGLTLVEWSDEATLFEKLCYYLAGEITEYQFSEDFSEAHSATDRVLTNETLFLVSYDRAVQRQFWLKAIGTIREILEVPENREKIEKLAQALADKNSLSHAEILTIVE